MRRFFIDPDLAGDDQVELSGPEARHLRTVLRMQPGDRVELFDGARGIMTAEISGFGPRTVVLRILERHRAAPPDRASLTVAQALLKGKKMDLLVQKCTELGVHTLQPLQTRFCENRTRLDRQHQRWQRIMLEACKQCGRTWPMRICEARTLEQFDTDNFCEKLLLWEQEHRNPLPATNWPASASICLLLGPEGGFHQAEVALARERGFDTVSLGPLVLRAETATLAAVSIIQFHTGALLPA
ncbi:16S rRNA (uracil(1498)-N(3))-methyltransferase [Desulfolithobacter sp.]